MVKILRHLSLSLTLLLISTSVYTAQSRYNMPRGVTDISREIYDLHMIIFWICVAIAVIVFGVLIYTLIMHRKSRGVIPAQFHGNTAIEITWAVIPFIILVIMAIPATRVLLKMDDTSKADVTVQITGHQWRWEYEYLNEDIRFISNLATPQEQIANKAIKGKWYLLEVDKPLVLPTQKKIRFLVTSSDVIHSWWIPEFGLKKDGFPGFINDGWAFIDKPGVYRGQCAELCGAFHAYMPIEVHAVTPEEYEQWVADQLNQKYAATLQASADLEREWDLKELMALGENVYQKACAVCHKPDGSGMPPAFPPLVADKVTVGPAEPHIKTVLYGKPGTAMQAFGGQLSNTEIAAVVTYERNAWGNDALVAQNNTESVIQPVDVYNLRDAGDTNNE